MPLSNDAVDLDDHLTRLGDDRVVVHLRDGAWTPVAALRWHLDQVLRTRPSSLVIDVAEMRRLSSATVALLLWTRRRCSARDVRVVVRRPSSASMEVLRRCGLDTTFVVEDGGWRSTRAGGDRGRRR